MKKLVALFGASALLLGACGTTGLEGNNTRNNGRRGVESVARDEMTVRAYPCPAQQIRSSFRCRKALKQQPKQKGPMFVR
ncbi:MAG: hypothetical protein U5K84_04085 [Alkalibacterium sp.]|nr:hypothetical protein [Alkalibacterium sp.]